MHAVETKDLSKRYGKVYALKNLDFTIDENEIMVLLGPNGSGKTTLANLITGFVRADSGEVLLEGRNITGLQPHKIANLGLTRTFQNMRPFHSLAAYKNLMLPLNSPRVRQSRGGKLGASDGVALDILEEIGFERDTRVPYKTAGSLPLGYQKRLELGRCIALRPTIIICDEIFSGLSMSEIATMIPLLEKLRKEGITLMMIEHRLRELFRLTDRVIVMQFGQKIAEGIPEEVMENQKVKDAYLGKERPK